MKSGTMNICLISLDCVRYDAFKENSFFKKLMGKSLSFDNCIAAAPHTSTSHASILTGLYPFHHGVRYLHDFDIKGKMLQEYLKEEGFRTAAFIGGYPLSTGNLDRGFDHFDYENPVQDVYEGRDKYVPANVIVQKSLVWLKSTSSEDKFLFLHFFDAHFTMRADFESGRRKKRYKEEIDFLVQQVKLLLELGDIDLLVITADHGDKLDGEHYYPWVVNSRGEKVGSHFHEMELYDIQIKVPLIFYSKELEPIAIEKQVRSIDILPTLLDFLNISYSNLDGQSLLSPLERGKESSRPAYSETYLGQLIKANKHTYEMHKKFDWGWAGHDSLVSLRTDEWKLICTANGEVKPYMLFHKGY